MRRPPRRPRKSRWTPLLALAVALSTCGLVTPRARADGDPGSDVLVYQSLFLASDSGISIAQQARLGSLLDEAQHAGQPIRIAVIATRSDLGAVTGLWLKPRAYARYLGLELSLAYTGRLLVVMPNGFGFNWPGHSSTAAYLTLSRIPIRSGGSGLAVAAQDALRSLAATAAVKHAGPSQRSGALNQGVGSGRANLAQSRSLSAGRSTPGSSLYAVLAAVAVLMAMAALGQVARRRRVRRSITSWPIPRLRSRPQRAALTLAGTLAVLAGATVVALLGIGPPGTAQSEALATNPNLDPGTPLRGPAPGFTLSDQFGQPVMLRSFRGKVVLLSFTDSECTTVCPLTTTAMLDAKAMLGRAGAQVQLLGVDANPKATTLEDVLSYSELHGMLHAWHFLTGSLAELRRVWKAYGVQAAIQGGEIAHTPALFVVDPYGRLARLYMTQQSYAAIGQLAQLLAGEASKLLPAHPAVQSHLSYAQIQGIGPERPVTLPRSGGGSVRLGPGRARLYLFFATWDQEITSLAGELDALNAYASFARSAQLPALTAVDAGSVEPSQGALRRFLDGLPRRLAYPVAIDSTGRVADGYEVQGQPWFVLVSPSGRIVWSWEVATSGWLSRAALAAHLRGALRRTPTMPATAAAMQEELAGAPGPLAALHQQSNDLLGPASALLTRVRELRGYPVVINAWASWCVPCQQEFGLFANLSARYGRQVAFLGADTEDSAGDAQAFLSQHPVSYPSYQMAISGLDPIVPQGLAGLPTTIFLSRTGRLVYVHTGQYQSAGALQEDIQSYALSG